MGRAVRAIAREVHPLLKQVKTIEVADIPRAPEAGDVPDFRSPYYRSQIVGHDFVVTLNEVLNFDVASFLAHVYEVGDAVGAQLVGGMLQHISDITEETGQVIDAQDKDFFDAMIEAAERIPFSFDEDGNPNLTVVIDPALAEKLSDKRPTLEQEARMSAVVEQRRREWNVARGRRALP